MFALLYPEAVCLLWTRTPSLVTSLWTYMNFSLTHHLLHITSVPRQGNGGNTGDSQTSPTLHRFAFIHNPQPLLLSLVKLTI